MSFFGRAACFHDVRASIYSDVLYPSSSCSQVSGMIFAVCFVWTNHGGVLLVLQTILPSQHFIHFLAQNFHFCSLSEFEMIAQKANVQ